MKQNRLFFLVVAFAFSFQSTSAQNSSPYWSLAGNSNASASSKLGTTTKTPLYLTTNNTTRLYISPSVGLVGIGTTAPNSKLAIVNTGSQPAAIWVSASGRPLFTGFAESTSGTADFMVAMASNTAGARPIFLGRRSRGTLAAPTTLSNKDYLLSLRATAYDGSAFQNSASIDFLVDGTPAAGRVPARISFGTGSNGSNKAERLNIASNGDISFNGGQLFIQKATGSISIGTPTPASGYKLDVTGKARITDGLVLNKTLEIVSTGEFPLGDAIIAKGTITGQQEDLGVHGMAHSIGVKGEGDVTGVAGMGGQVGVDAYGEIDGLHAYGLNNSGIVTTGAFVGVDAYTSAPDGYAGVFHGNAEGIGIIASGGDLAGKFLGDVYASGTYQTSDKNLKQNVKEFQDAMNIINKLKPRNYEFKTDSRLAVLGLPKGSHYGLIAQDVEQVLPNLVKEVRHDLNVFDTTKFSLQTAQKGKPERPAKEMLITKAVNYTELIPIIVKGMQEQEAEIKEKDKRIADLEARLSKLEALMTNGASGMLTSTSGYLEQNTPNPVSGTTVIRYHIAETATSAMLNITNAKGQLVKTININTRDAGQANLNTAMLAAGTYNYTLYLDSKPVDTKRLIVAK